MRQGIMKHPACAILLLFVSASPVLAQGRDGAKTRYLIVHAGSLSGMGLGGSVALTPAVNLEATLGLPSFLTAVVGQPFAGNWVNATVTVQLKHGSGLYLAPGLHAGYYRMMANDKNNLRRVEETETLLLTRPTVAVGFEGARQSRRFNFEIGVALLLPERITRDLQRGSRTWLFEAERSIGGPLFPFYTFRMKV